MYIRRFTWSKEDKSIEECFTGTGILPGGCLTLENQRELLIGDDVTAFVVSISVC